jgi:hypothetical protein
MGTRWRSDVATLATRAAVVIIFAVAWMPAVAAAQDKTLNEGYPVRLGDAFPIARGEGAVLLGSGVSLQRESPNRGFFPLSVQYGILPRTQLTIATVLSSHPHDVDDPHSGDVTANGRVNFGRETTVLPSFAALLGLTAPTGVDSHAVVLTLKGYATKTVTNTVYLHANAAMDVADRVRDDERRARYRVAAGPSMTVPWFATVLVVADVFAEQSLRSDRSTTVGIEGGLRQRITANLYWHAGVGTELAGPRDRAALIANVGIAYNFVVPGAR